MIPTREMKYLDRKYQMPGHHSKGFTLIEMLVAMAVFLVVAGAAFSVFSRHAALVTRQQNLSGVNIGLRNAMAQLQMDLSGAGQNLLSGVKGAQPFNLGIVIRNNVPGVAAACSPNTTNWSYPTSSACFDSLTIANPKAGCPVLDIDDPGSSAESLSTSSIIWGNDPNNPGDAPTLTNDASCFKNGDEILVVALPNGPQQPQCDSGSFNYCMAVVTLTQDAQVSGNKVQLQHNPTGATSDPLGIAFNAAGNNFAKANSLNSNFNNGSYVIDMGTGAGDITYAVQANPANANDVQLVRCLGSVCTNANSQPVTDQVIGFKVGAALWDNAQTGATDIANYFYDASKYCSDAIGGADCTTTPPPSNDPYDFTLIRSIRVSMIARTTPQTDATLAKFQNGFDNGPYLVQQASVVVDLRNMTIPDFGN